MKEIKLFYKNDIRVEPDLHGIPRIYADSLEDALFGQGYVEAEDRGMQMLFMRIISQGRICEQLGSSNEMLEADIFFRKMNWGGDSVHVAESLDSESRVLVNAWIAGVNKRFRQGLPFELRLAGYRYEDWRIEDIIILSRMVGYLGLQQTQSQVERFLVEMVQAGIPEAFLKEMFPGSLDSLDIPLLRRVKLSEKNLPAGILWNNALPSVTATNSWVISPDRTESGKAILANDPHLDGNRLPNIWQEMCLVVQDRYMTGFTMPGLPGILIGRTNDLSWGASYSFMDSVDSWVEECREGKCKRMNKNKVEWIRFHERREIIKRKRKSSHKAVFYENEHGTLDGNPFVPGMYLSSRWTVTKGTGAVSIKAILDLFHAKDVMEGKEILGGLEMSFCWVLADKEGNIGMQMSGLMPKRSPGVSGLCPLPGWDAANDWKGFVPAADLPSRLNPKEGYIITANNDLNQYGKAKPINVPMGPERAKRIEELLYGNTSVNLRQMSEIQYDDYSIQAREYMEVLAPVLPDSHESEILKTWDCRYNENSEGAKLFEVFYRCLLEEVFGKVFGMEVFRYIENETRLLIVGYHLFDRVLLSHYSQWFGDRTREEIYLSAAIKAFREGSDKKDRKRNLVPLKNILLGKNPLFFFMNRKAISVPGGRSSIFQLQSYRTEKRDLKLLPTFRMLVDFSMDGIFANLLGGPSDRPFSALYDSDVENWRKSRYRHQKP